MLGGWIATFLHMCVRKTIFDNVENLLFKPSNVTKNNFLQYILVSTVGAIVGLLTIISTFQVVDNNFEIPLEWQVNL